MRCGILVAAALMAAVLSALPPAAARRQGSAGPPMAHPQLPSDYPIHFTVIGDWGRRRLPDRPTGYNQTRVAAAMAARAARWPSKKADFVISTGDNFYGIGLRKDKGGVNDPQFTEKFTDVYNQSSLNVPWLSVLGNHDYGDSAYCDPKEPDYRPNEISDPFAQLDPALQKRDPRWHAWLNQKLTLAGGKVDIFMIDTSPFEIWYYPYCFAHWGLNTQHWVKNLAWLDSALEASTAEWKLIVGHHGTVSSGKHGGSALLRATLEPLIWKYKAQALFAGHDHTLEHLHVVPKYPDEPNYHIVVSGGGSKRNSKFGTPNKYSIWGGLHEGFAACTLTSKALTVQFFSLDHAGGREPAHNATIPRVLLKGRSPHPPSDDDED